MTAAESYRRRHGRRSVLRMPRAGRRSLRAASQPSAAALGELRRVARCAAALRGADTERREPRRSSAASRVARRRADVAHEAPLELRALAARRSSARLDRRRSRARRRSTAAASGPSRDALLAAARAPARRPRRGPVDRAGSPRCVRATADRPGSGPLYERERARRARLGRTSTTRSSALEPTLMVELLGIVDHRRLLRLRLRPRLPPGARLMRAGDLFGLVVSIARLRVPRLRAVPRREPVTGNGIAPDRRLRGRPDGARVPARRVHGARLHRHASRPRWLAAPERGFYRLVGIDAGRASRTGRATRHGARLHRRLRRRCSTLMLRLQGAPAAEPGRPDRRRRRTSR